MATHDKQLTRDELIERIRQLEKYLVEERAKAFCWGAWELQEDEDLDEWRAEARAELAAEGLLLPTTEEER